MSSLRAFRLRFARPEICLTVALAAVTLCVAQALARPAVKPRFEAEIRAFEAADRKMPPPKNPIVFVGSSGIRRWKTLQQDFPGLPVINRGFGGSQIHECTRYADRIVLPYHPRKIVFRAGGNDIAAHKTPAEVAGNFKLFVEKVRRAQPDVPILFLAINPSIKRWDNRELEGKANRLIREYIGTQKNLEFIDIATPMLGKDGRPRRELFADDLLHNSPEGYRLWTSLVKPRL